MTILEAELTTQEAAEILLSLTPKELETFNPD